MHNSGEIVIELKKLTIVNAAVARALIRALGMHAENMQRDILGQSLAYDEKAFLSVINEEQLGFNDVITLITE